MRECDGGYERMIMGLSFEKEIYCENCEYWFGVYNVKNTLAYEFLQIQQNKNFREGKLGN